MDVRQLRYFLKIVECRSISRASAELRVAQPALSQHVAHLEDELGVQLLVRSSKGILPTECGLTLLAHAEAIIRQVEIARIDVLEHSRSPSAKVSIGIPSSVSQILAPRLLRAAKQRFPTITLRVIENHSGFLTEWVRAGRIDLAILFDAETLPGLTVLPLLKEELYLICPADAEPGTVEIPFSRLAELPLVLTGRPHGIRTLVDRVAAAAGLELNVTAEVDALSALRDLVASGFAYSVLPWPAIEPSRHTGELRAVRIVEPVVVREVQLVTASDLPPRRSSELIKRLAEQLILELVSDGTWRGVPAARASSNAVQPGA